MHLALLAANNITPSSISNPDRQSGKLTGPSLWPSITLPAQAGNYFATNPSTGYSYNGVAKLDHNFTDKHHFSIRWFGGQGSQTAPLGGSAALGDGQFQPAVLL